MRRRRQGRDERGVAVILLALTITSVLLAAAFAVDVGWWYVRAQQVQRAADAAALAGVVWMPGDFSRAASTALESARTNGFVDGVDDVSVQVSVGATERQLAVRIVDGKVARFFSGASSSDPVSIGRRAVAQYELPVPLGGPESQLGGGINGLHLAVNGFCSRRSEGDDISSAYYHPTPTGNIDCRTPYATSTPTSPVAKNPDYRSSGYTYVVNIPPKLSDSTCRVASPPSDCSHTGTDVTIQVQDPKINTNVASPVADIYAGYANAIGCGASRPGTTLLSVYRADGTPLDDSDNPLMTPPGIVSEGLEAATSSAWEDLVTVPLGSLSGRYLVRVRSAADQACAAWSNAFGIRAQRGSTFTLCSTITSAASYAASCPQVYGLDAMGLRASVAGGLVPCTTTSVAGDLCATFYLAQVDPAYAGRQMVITLFDPGEGAQRLRVLAPDRTTASGLKSTAFTFQTSDTGTSISGSAGAANGLDVTGNQFNDRKLQLSLTIPTAADLAVSSGWFKVEYEVVNGSTLIDRTTWGVTVHGTPVHLVV